MHRIIRDKATPKTGGRYSKPTRRQEMNNQSHTNIYIQNPLCPLWALWQAKKCETNPISSRRPPQLCETNPITPAADHWKPKKCETNPIRPHAHPDPCQKCETNPIATPACRPERWAAVRNAAAQSRGLGPVDLKPHPA